MRRLSCLQVIALSAPLLAAPQEMRVRWSDQRLPTAAFDAQRDLVVRIVDGVTGEPLPGAEAFHIQEQRHPQAGEFAFSHRATADADGLVHLPRPVSWLMTRAQGFGPAMGMDGRDRVVPLARGLEVPVRCEDWRGAPLVGYLAGFCGGCGHTPDLVTARTDSAGIAVLSGVDPGNGIADLYLAHAPIAFGYDSIEWESGDLPVVHRFGPGRVLHGLVLDAEGEPAANVVLGAPQKHRGPWSRTDAAGRFVLGGLSPDDTLLVIAGGRQIEFSDRYESPCTLRLPSPGPEAFVQGDPAPSAPTGMVRCTVTFAPGGGDIDGTATAIAPSAAIVAIGPLPASRRHTHDENGELLLAAGHYELRCRAPDHGESRTAVDVAAGAVREVAFVLAPLPTTTLVVLGLPDGGSVELIDGADTVDITLAVRLGAPIAIDAARDYCLLLQADDERRAFPVTGTALLLQQKSVFRWFAPTRLFARVVDARGVLQAAQVALLPSLPLVDVDGPPTLGFDPRANATMATTGEVALETTAQGLAWLWLAPTSADLRPRLVPVSLPPRGDAVHCDLGGVQLAASPPVRFLAADGAPLQRGIALLRAGRSDFREHCFRVFALDQGGGWLGPDLRPGDALLVPEDDEPSTDATAVPTVRLPLRHVVTALALTTVQVPTGRVHVFVHDEAGAPIDDATLLWRECMWSVDAELAITQVPAGTHRFLVGSADHRTAVVDLQLVTGEQRDVRLMLPPRR